MTILAVGGTGQVGSLVVEHLVAKGLPVKVLTRDPRKVRVPQGAEATKGDVLDADAFRAALRGVTTLFLLNPVVPDETTRALLALELAAAAGVTGIVYVSMTNADVLPDVPHAVAKHAAERLIAERVIGVTVLRPNYFMQNDAQVRASLEGDGVYTMPIGHGGAAMVDVRDIADVAARELARRHAAASALPNCLIDVSGPEVLTATEVCAIWSETLGHPVRYAGDDLDSFERRIAAHIPAFMALDIALMFRAWQRIGVLPRPGAAGALAALLGRPLRSYRAFAAECAAAWRSKAAASEGAAQ